MNAEAFEISVDEGVLVDLRKRIEAMRWPAVTPGLDARYGFEDAKLRELVAAWKDYDWRAVERQINGFSHFRVTIDDVPIHFIHAKGKGPNPVPLILTHGWPWTFWDMHKVIGPLSDPGAHGGDPADAFDVVVVSPPGFTFSSPLPRTGISPTVMADILHRLMTEVLGYSRYSAAGGDWGARITEELGHKYADSLYGIHTTGVIPVDLFNHERYWDITAGLVPYDTPEAIRRAILPHIVHAVSHVAVQSVEPQTLSYAMQDSPVGMLAWLAQRRYSWSDTRDSADPFSVEHLLTTATLYWVTESFGSAACIYAEAARHPWAAAHDRVPRIEAPTGITFFGGENLPGTSIQERVDRFLTSSSAANYNLHLVKGHERGGHFAHYENPQACIEDIRENFRGLR